jgi:1,4-dihydroxy-2-naphthoyl-CoA synthase
MQLCNRLWGDSRWIERHPPKREVAKEEFRRRVFVKLDYVSIEKRDGVAIVCFDRKANLNAFNEKLVVELTQAVTVFSMT